MSVEISETVEIKVSISILVTPLSEFNSKKGISLCKVLALPRKGEDELLHDNSGDLQNQLRCC